MAITITDKGFAAQTADQADYTFGTIAPTSSVWLFIDVISRIGSGTPPIPTVEDDGPSLTYSTPTVYTVKPTGGSAGNARVTRFYAWTGTSPGTFSFTVKHGTTMVGCSLHVVEVGGAHTTNPIQQGGATTGQSTTAQYGFAVAPQSGNTTLNTTVNGAPAMAAESGHTELRETSGDPGNYNAETMWFTGTPPPDQTPSVTWTGSSYWGILCHEIAAYVAGGAVVSDPFGMAGFFGA